MAQLRMIGERYEVLSEIGRGGMGLVARAFDGQDWQWVPLTKMD